MLVPALGVDEEKKFIFKSILDFFLFLLNLDNKVSHLNNALTSINNFLSSCPIVLTHKVLNLN